MMYRVQNFVTQFRGDTSGQVAIATSKISMQLNHPPPLCLNTREPFRGGSSRRVPPATAALPESLGADSPRGGLFPVGGCFRRHTYSMGAILEQLNFLFQKNSNFCLLFFLYVFFKFWRDAFFRIFVSLDHRCAFRLASYPP